MLATSSALYFSDSKNGWAVGVDFMTTTNGGNSWTRDTIAAGINLLGVGRSKTALWAAGYNGYVYKVPLPAGPVSIGGIGTPAEGGTAAATAKAGRLADGSGLWVQLPRAARVSVGLFSAGGKRLSLLADETRPAGYQVIRLPRQARGVSFIEVRAGNFKRTFAFRDER